ncbi:PREDICTED: vacuolar protein sorting-associated protein 13D-like [Amphimedon queenslandica]|uniref:Vacuolar protein sorting-associated protein 13 VPS13 adaptor binding domain-containing protein n=1 Tax=Amphimedon queenslandica TaxID=400682 RepID=A0AAN0JPA2_AMPQE|nr:PREDICTED: vacuolar protein sorting-associated protein 13D-like [Amphimedon queenslandica]|eukprot:XP_019858653.1 PREDICTED: vacuolar protein sorting-associated protein 13D-like [Amphimedon queenslandica]
MESHVEENQYSTADEVMYEMKALPSSQEPELQCQVQPQHSKKYTEDKWLLCIIAIVLVVILVLLIILVFMCGFLISQPSPAECSTTATGAAVAGLTATDNQMCQLCNETLIHFAQEIRKSIGNIVNGTTNSTQSLVQGSIEQLALLVDIAQEINRNVNNAHYGTNEILSHITNVTHINNFCFSRIVIAEATMERLVEESQSSTADEVMHEMKALPSSQEPKLQCQVQPQHSKKYTGDKWLLGVVALVLAVSCTAMGDESYQSVQPMSLTRENEYELAHYSKGEIEPQPHIVSDSKSSHQFCVEVTKDTASNIPNHTICLRSVFTVTNLLPYGFHFSFKSKEKLIPSGKEVAIHNVNSLRPVTFSISKLESFEFSDKCTVSITEVGVVKSLIVRDKANCSLNLHVNTELMSKGSLKVVIWCPYWLINRTSLPLVFTSQGDSSGGKCAGQFEEHETATSMSPLLFSYSEDDLLQKCQVRLGRGQDEGVPSWSNGFRMLRDEDVLRLFVKRGQGRPDKEYQIGMEVKKGTGVYKPTKVVTFVARFQLENRTTFNLKYLQRHLVFAKDESSSDSVPVIAPGAVMAFHWPRADLDQLLCIRVVELSDCHWSGGFPLEQDKSFHINMRY